MVQNLSVGDIVLYDYVSNYFYPNYVLPWNNFYTKVDANPWYLSNEQRNQTAREVKSPLVFDSNPSIIIQSTHEYPEPNWKHSLQLSPSGEIVFSRSEKVFAGKHVAAGAGVSFKYLYQYMGEFTCLEDHTRDSEQWVIIQLNLANTKNSHTQKVTTASCIVKDEYKISGFLTADNSIVIPIVGPHPPSIKHSHDSNAIFGLYGNRIFIAVKTDLIQNVHILSYSVSVEINESPSSADILGMAVL